MVSFAFLHPRTTGGQVRGLCRFAKLFAAFLVLPSLWYTITSHWLGQNARLVWTKTQGREPIWGGGGNVEPNGGSEIDINSPNMTSPIDCFLAACQRRSQQVQEPLLLVLSGRGYSSGPEVGVKFWGRVCWFGKKCAVEIGEPPSVFPAILKEFNILIILREAF